MTRSTNEPIAIVGTACRFPGSCDTPSKLWELLKSPRDLLRRVPESRFNAKAYFHPDGNHHGTTDAQESYFLDENPTQFDNGFFNIQPSESEAIDPQQRMLMETVYDSLCAAGQKMENLRGSNTGIYVGMMCDDWGYMTNRDWDLVHTYAATGTSRAVMSNRVSYYFDWHGPSMTIDTACSSSLVAVHLAVQALRSGESHMAVAAGVNLILSPGMYVAESKLHMLSPTGRCRMWDADADGYSRGEGLASIVMKPLSQALADGDHIECIIRETGINQDGRTAGLTMPSHTAQAKLIRDTYTKANLDINNPQDRPQFFHAHGTGTPAGDPQESHAISSAFFGAGSPKNTLYVGSVKTIIGHTEGTAGLASLISTSLAIQNRTISPNMHFKTLSPSVKPFYGSLKIPTEAIPWPQLSPGQPRRASINSFGFGGTNAHAIIESFDMPESASVEGRLYAPLAISAASQFSLRATLSDLRIYLTLNPKTNLKDLAYTLNSRRSTLAFRKAIVGGNVKEVIDAIDIALDTESQDQLSTRYSDIPKPRILGVFTGQGAQWPRMGARLLESSPSATKRLAELDDALSSLPESDRPKWTLRDQILAEASVSRMSEAAISQPVCTAVQILLVDMLAAANITFEAVVGHSSGEIGAAYASNLVTAPDAIRIAYYRGFHAKLAKSPNGEGIAGAMMAVGTTYEDATEFCQLEDYEGRLQVAACNSSSSVTLSGDINAVEEAMEIFKEEGKFARQLKVDTAYHSAHMLACAPTYLDSLEQCRTPNTACKGNGTTWFSSVVEGQVMTEDNIQPQYWVDNMTNAVLLSSAVSTAFSKFASFDMIVEIGPHPALKGPCLDTVQEVFGKSLPYTGLLSRNKHDVEQVSSALGYVWQHLGSGIISLMNFDAHASGEVNVERRIMPNLPKYPFEHSRSFYALSRVSGMHMNINQAPHPLLGRRCVEQETASEVRWRNMLRPGEISWLSGHRIQGQTLFPATGYIAMAVEAAASLADGKPVQEFCLTDFVIGRAMGFNDELLGLETSVSLKIVQSTKHQIDAEFLCHSGLPFDHSSTMTLNASASISMIFGGANADNLPLAHNDEINLVDTDPEDFYASLSKLGYNYSFPFTGVRQIERRAGYATGRIQDESEEGWENDLIVHPSMLDTAIQTGLAAYSAPRDERLWTLHVPTAVNSIRINPYFTKLDNGKQRALGYQSVIDSTVQKQVTADIDIIVPTEGEEPHLFVRFDSIRLKPFAGATAADDTTMFSRFQYKLADPSGLAAVASDIAVTPQEAACITAAERLSFFYLRQLLKEITFEMEPDILPHFRRLLSWGRYIVDKVSKGTHANVPRDAMHDTRDSVMKLIERHSNAVDVKLAIAVGENICKEIKSNGSTLEHMLKDGELDRFYEEAVGLNISNVWIGRMVSQIAHRYPNANILEVGAGTGGATRAILPELGGAFASYTYTDISAGFFNRVEEEFQKYGDRMIYRTFDMEKSAADQGFEEQTYDIIIASNVLHATGMIDEAMSNVRQLLKPGGYLVPLEVQSNEFVGVGLIMGSLPGWWAGAEQDSTRSLGPALTLPQWDALLKRTGYSGVDTATPSMHKLHMYCVFAAQAVDDSLRFLRAPLTEGSESKWPQLAIVGGATPKTESLVEDIMTALQPQYLKIQQYRTLHELHDAGVENMCSVLSLTELDAPYFLARSSQHLESLRTLWRRAGSILWVTQNCLDLNPYSSMILGLSRAMRFEYPNISLQMFDLDVIATGTSQLLSDALLRLESLTSKRGTETESKILFSLEPELQYKDNELLIPRIYPYKAANNRFNTYRRTVYENIDTEGSDISLVPQGPSYQLVKRSPLRRTSTSATDSYRSFKVARSVLQMVNVAHAGFFMLSSGLDTATGKPLIALSKSTDSYCSAPANWTINTASLLSAERLAFVASYLIAESVLSHYPSCGTVVVHDADPLVRHALTTEAAKIPVEIVYTSSVDHGQSIFVHTKSSKRLVKKILPTDIALFVNLGRSEAGVSTGKLIASIIATSVPVLNSRDLFGSECSTTMMTQVSAIDQAFRHAWRSSATTGGSHDLQVPLVKLQQLETCQIMEQPLSVLSWQGDVATASLEAIDTGNIFRGDGTYFMVGLSGQLGQAIAQWMVGHGARHIVLTSRNPKVDPKYIQNLQSVGASVKIIPMDVTCRDSVEAAHEEICETMPPIIGVANGAMVLEDVLFDNLTYDSFERSVAAKIDGSLLLDEIFYSTELDFFILFSSLGSVIGNTGQASYIAANQFMVALAAQRKKRGVCGSAIAISSLQGIGYISRADFDRDYFTRLGYHNVAEQDVYQLFAESIITGRPDSLESHELVTGLGAFKDEDGIQNQLRKDPKFGHYRIRETSGVSDTRQSSSIPIRTRLADAKSKQDVFDMIQDAFFERLRRILILTGDEAIDEQRSLVEQGVDSIVAVEVRTWFLKELDIDMPVVKILSVSTTALALLSDATELVPENIVKRDTFDAEAAPPPERNIQSRPASEGTGSSTPLLNSDTFTSNSVSQPTTPETLSDSEDDTGKARHAPMAENGTKEEVLSLQEVMSFGQSRFWFLAHYVKDPKTFNMSCMIKLNGRIKVEELRRAVEEIGNRHEILRTRYKWSTRDSDPPIQEIRSNSLIKLEHVRIESDADADICMNSMQDHDWRLDEWFPMRIQLLSLSDEAHYLLVGGHHISLDGYSFNILFLDLDAAYSKRPMTKLPDISQFKAFAAQQRQALENGKMARAIKYYNSVIYDDLQPIDLFSFAKSSLRTPLKRYKTHESRLRLPATFTSKVKAIARKHQSTSFHFYLAALQALVFCILPETDSFYIGMTDANRLDKNFVGTLGNFLNLLPLKFERRQGNSKFGKVIQDTRNQVYEALEHSIVPFDVLLDELSIQRSNSYAPIFQILIDYRLVVKKPNKWADCRISDEKWQIAKIGYDLGLEIVDNPAGDTEVVVRLQDSLYSEESTKLLLRSYVHVLEQITRDESLPIHSITPWATTDIEKAIQVGKGRELTLKWPETISHSVDQMIQSHPDAIALCDGYGSLLTYKTMGNRIEGIANQLKATSVSPGSIVGVFQRPSVDWICSLLAILRIGAVYMPLDLRSSVARLRRIVEISSPTAIIIDDAMAPLIQDISSSSNLIINASQVDETVLSTINCAKAGTRAVILFTSGSTGEPKGIILSHDNLKAHFEGFFHSWDLGRTTGVVLQQIAFTFDLSISQIFIALTSGGSLYVAPAEARGDPQALTKIIRDHNVTYTLATPSELGMWFRFAPENLQNCPSWKTASFGGELASAGLIESFRNLDRQDLRLFNVYGPAEASVSAVNGEVLYHNEDVDLSLPGQLLPNYTAYIADENLKPLPIGVPGEIILGGQGIAMGYLGLESENAEKFFANPLKGISGNHKFDRVYRTGDRGRFLADGSLICEGRLEGDTQVKIRGIRVELGELESVIVSEGSGAISQAIVTAKDDLLVAYVLFATTISRVHQDDLLKKLSHYLPLPAYMCPSFFFRLEEMPLTGHGKANRKAIKSLPLPDTIHLTSGTAERSLTATETAVAALWRKLISHDVTGLQPSTNFFKVGGNSLLLVKLQHLIRQEMGVSLPLLQLMNGTELNKMASLIDVDKTTHTIDWDAEIGLGSLIPPPRSSLPSKPKHDNIHILMTGATGQLGRRLLHQMISNDCISSILCLVRASSAQHYKEMLSNSPKIRLVIADLGQASLGISEKDFGALSNNVDLILHCAANRSFWDGYQTVRPVNVIATKALANLAARKRTPIHLLSSGEVSSFEMTDGDSLPRPPTDGSDGYVASKWAVERYVTNIAKLCEIPIIIHRPTKAVRSDAARIGNGAVIQELLDMAGTMSTRPDFTGVKGTVALAPVDQIAADILATLSKDHSQTNVRVVEHYATLTADIDEYLRREDSVAHLPLMPALQWIGEAKKSGFAYMFTGHELTMSDGEGRSLVSRR